jgi:hypothetical protein
VQPARRDGARRDGARRDAAGLAAHLARRYPYPDRDEIGTLIDAGDWLVPSLLARICQCVDRDDLVEEIRGWWSVPPPELEKVAKLAVPGIFYLPFDGLMGAALAACDRSFRELDRLGGDGSAAPAVVTSMVAAGQRAPLLLVNVRGRPTADKSLVLTESELELLDRIPAGVAGEVLDFVRQPGRSFLVLGCSPRDPLLHRVARLLDADPSASQGPCFLVSSRNDADDRYWKPYRVEWVDAEPAEVVDALLDLSGAAP